METYRGLAEERVYVQPGSLYVADRPTLINTVLGSSVSVCLWSPTVAGLNHFILPIGGVQVSARYGKHALPMLLEKMIECGANVREMLAAVFGGASLDNLGADATLGRRNIHVAQEFLFRHDIPVIRHDVGGDEARKLTFRTVDGSTIVRRL